MIQNIMEIARMEPRHFWLTALLTFICSIPFVYAASPMLEVGYAVFTLDDKLQA
jgi:hypothetical protein